ncbi:MAG: cupin domain-containing protein [Angustibacter sp.]
MTTHRLVPGIPRALVRAPGEGELLTVAGVDHLFQLTGADTGGAFALEVFTVPPGTLGARPHVHHAHDEYFYVLDGELTVHTGDGEVVAGPRHLVAAVRGTPHGFRNAGGSVVQALCLYTPAGYEGYFRDVHAAVTGGAVATDDLLAGFRARYRTTAHPAPPSSRRQQRSHRDQR